MDYITLGKNVRKYRLICGFNQEELAGKCSCSNSHIGQIENARDIPRIAERIEKYPVARRIQACEGFMAYLDSLEKFSQ